MIFFSNIWLLALSLVLFIIIISVIRCERAPVTWCTWMDRCITRLLQSTTSIDSQNLLSPQVLDPSRDIQPFALSPPFDTMGASLESLGSQYEVEEATFNLIREWIDATKHPTAPPPTSEASMQTKSRRRAPC